VPIHRKESNKWLVGLTQSVQHLPAHQVVTVCDREGDIYELFATAAAQDAHFLVRMVRNRRTDAGMLVAEALAQGGPQTYYPLRVGRRP
jgi:hypothetical protein